jgi:HAD superfamily hydrolase (TIGR01509 family)
MHESAVGFDFDHTLGIDNRLETEAFVILAQQRAQSMGRSLIEERARVAIGRELGNYRSGKCSFDDAIINAFEDALGNGAGDRGAVDAFRTLAVELVPRYVEALPGVSETLHGLDAASIQYAILTNGWNPLQQHKADHIGFTKPVFVSDDLGVRKPSVQAFNILRDYFNVPPERIWYVGDDPKIDVLGALGAGMRSVWCNFDRQKFPTDIPAPTAIVTNMRDILSIIPLAAKERLT